MLMSSPSRVNILISRIENVQPISPARLQPRHGIQHRLAWAYPLAAHGRRSLVEPAGYRQRVHIHHVWHLMQPNLQVQLRHLQRRHNGVGTRSIPMRVGNVGSQIVISWSVQRIRTPNTTQISNQRGELQSMQKQNALDSPQNQD